MKHPLGHSRNDIAVFVDLIQSEAAKHIAQQPHLLGLVREALQHASLRGPNVTIEHDMKRAIGYSFVVSTSDSDAVFYAQLVRDATYTRFVKNGEPLATQHLTLVLHRNEDDATYNLHDAWIGRLNPPRPGSTEETDESKTYWANHALILGNQPLQLRSVTKICPY
jgi:hypothetical protein